MELYNQKRSSYFSNIRIDLVQFIPKSKDNKILEIGAGGGDTLIWIKENGLAREVVGLELNRLEGSNQMHPAIDKFYFVDLEKSEIDLPFEYFDVLICGDVLEHLVNPWRVLQKMVGYLKIGGTIIVSCPNIRNYKTFINIFMKGSFKYDEHGLYDKTHLRFFCRKDLMKMISDEGLMIEKVIPTFKLVKSPKVRALNILTLGIMEEFLAIQYVVAAKK